MDRAISGARSVVNRSVPSYEVWAGVLARRIKERPSGRAGEMENEVRENGEHEGRR